MYSLYNLYNKLSQNVLHNPPPPQIQSNKSLGSVLLVIYCCTNCVTTGHTSTVLVYVASKAKVPEWICYKQTYGMYTSQELYDSVSTYVRRYLFEQLVVEGMVLNATFNSISVISLRSVILVGSHMEQPCAIHERITEVHKAFPNSTLLSSPYFPKVLTIPFSFFSKFSFRSLRIWWVGLRFLDKYTPKYL